MNQLTGKNVLLRAVEPSDVDTILSFENNTGIWKVSNTLSPYSRFDIEEYVLNARRDIFSARQLRLMIDRTGIPLPVTTIGTIDLFDFDPLHLRAGIGIMIDAPSRKNGFAGEALDLLLSYCLDLLHLHQVYGNISASNMPSIRLFESRGFTRTAEKTDWINTGEGWETEYLYQLIF